MRVALYTRISTDEDRQPFSLGAQEERLRAYVSSQEGWTVVAHYCDQASGFRLDRANLTRARNDARAGVFDMLLVYRAERLSRSVANLSTIAEELEKAGVYLRSATEPFDTSTPAGRMMLQMLVVFAEFERRLIIDRITAGMERGAKLGRWVVGRVPFGYERSPGDRKDPRTKLLAIVAAQAAIVGRIFSLYVNDLLGTDAIASLLNSQGHRTKDGRLFSTNSVVHILRNPIYVGEVEFKGIRVPGLHEPIIDRETFARAQGILTERGGSQALKRGNPTDYLLSGVVRCGRCRKAYIGTSAKGRSSLYHYYVCSTRYRYGTEHCDGDRLSKEALEDAIISQLIGLYSDTDVMMEALEEARAQRGNIVEETALRLAAIRQEISTTRRSLDRYFAAFEDGSLSSADCAERIRALRERIDALSAQEASIRRHAEAAEREAHAVLTREEIATWAVATAQTLRTDSPQRRKQLLRELVREIKIDGNARVMPTYRLPALVRAPDGQVEKAGHYSNQMHKLFHWVEDLLSS